MSWRPVVTALFLSLIPVFPAGSANAAACSQDRAIYTDRAGAYELTFEPADSESSASSHRFRLKVVGTELSLDGFVMGSEPVDRTNGMIFNNCPEGDVTGADLAACTVWEGVVYATLDQEIGLLPAATAQATRTLLLPGFGPALQESSAWGPGKASIAPWDVFTFKGCQS